MIIDVSLVYAKASQPVNSHRRWLLGHVCWLVTFLAFSSVKVLGSKHVFNFSVLKIYFSIHTWKVDGFGSILDWIDWTVEITIIDLALWYTKSKVNL